MPRFFILGKNAVSSVIGSMLMISIIITSMTALLLVSSDNNNRAIEMNNMANELHAQLLNEMQEFYITIIGTIPGMPDKTDNEAPIIKSANPADLTADVATANVIIEIEVFDPDDDYITVWFYPWGENVEEPIDTVQVKTVRNGEVVTFTYDSADQPGTEYYWSVAICDPWHVPSAELFMFKTAIGVPI